MPPALLAKRAKLGRPPSSDAARTILDVAERLAQTKGFNGFSYSDIADELGVTKASLHYHFRSKAELGRALIARYRQSFAAALEEIDRTTPSSPAKLRRYAGLYEAVMKKDRMCLCGMLAAEHATLPAPMRSGLKSFFDLNEHWLTAVLQQGRKAKTLTFTDTPRERAVMILGALEGAMLVARSYGDARRFTVAADHMVTDLVAGRAPA